MSPFAIVLAVGAGTYLIRVSVIALAGRLREPSPTTVDTLRLIAPAVLAAIVADQLAIDDGELGAEVAWLLAAVVAGVVAYRFRSAGVTMLVGLATVWLVEWIT